MKNIYMIDFENVYLQGLYGMSELNKNDEIIVFHSDEKMRRIVEDITSVYKEVGIKISFRPLVARGKNALDFMISVQMGYEVKDKTPKAIHIISKDNGYFSAIQYAMELNPKMIVDRAPSIYESIHRGAMLPIIREDAPSNKTNMTTEQKMEYYKEAFENSNLPSKYEVTCLSVLKNVGSLPNTKKDKILKAVGKKYAAQGTKFIDSIAQYL